MTDVSLLDPDALRVLELVRQVPRKAPWDVPLAEARDAFRHARRALAPDPPDIADVRDAVAEGDDGPIPVRIYRASGTKPRELLPALLYAHGGGFMQGYLSIFGQEGIGRPELEIAAEIDSIKKHLAKKLDNENDVPEINGALIFTNDLVEIEENDAPTPALKLKQLKDFMRQKSKEKPVGSLTLEKIKSVLPQN